MRFFASWWERIPARQFGPSLATALVLGYGFGFGSVSDFVNVLLNRAGSYWT